MTSRLLPVMLAAAAAAADASGRHGLGSVLVLLAIPCAAGAAFLGVGDALNGRDLFRGVTTTLALVLLVVGSAVRAHAAVGAAVPTFALSATIGAILVYALPLVGWVLQPLKPKPRTRTRPARIRTSP